MSARVVKSFSWLWIAALLTATVGISVQQIYCYCMGKVTISLFGAEDACAAGGQSDPFDCCATQEPQPVPSCCAANDETCGTDHDGCTEKSTKVFQLKTEFLVDKQSDKSSDCPLWLREMPMFKRFFRPAICEAVFSNKPPPPPLSGRDISLRHQLFRC